jgi:hypothetical protein
MEPANPSRQATAARRRRLRWAALLITAAAILVVAVLAPEADAYVYWANHNTDGRIMRAGLNGQGTSPGGHAGVPLRGGRQLQLGVLGPGR